MWIYCPHDFCICCFLVRIRFSAAFIFPIKRSPISVEWPWHSTRFAREHTSSFLTLAKKRTLRKGCVKIYVFISLCGKRKLSIINQSSRTHTHCVCEFAVVKSKRSRNLSGNHDVADSVAVCDEAVRAVN